MSGTKMVPECQFSTKLGRDRSKKRLYRKYLILSSAIRPAKPFRRVRFPSSPPENQGLSDFFAGLNSSRPLENRGRPHLKKGLQTACNSLLPDRPCAKRVHGLDQVLGSETVQIRLTWIRSAPLWSSHSAAELLNEGSKVQLKAGAYSVEAPFAILAIQRTELQRGLVRVVFVQVVLG